MKKSEPIGRWMDDTGCLTGEDLRRYISGNASREEMDRMNGHMKDCAFCREALEGYAAFGNPEKFSIEVDDLKERIWQDVQARNKILNLAKRRSYILLAAAASVLLLAGLFSVIRFYPDIRKNFQEAPMAENNKPMTGTDRKVPATENIQPAATRNGSVPLQNAKRSGNGNTAKADKIKKPVQAVQEIRVHQAVEKNAPSSLANAQDTVVEQSDEQVAENKPAAGIPVSPSSDARLKSESFSMRKMTISGNSRQMNIHTSMKPGEEKPDVFFVVKDMPKFRGKGMDEFEKYIQDNIKYPDEARKKGIEGTVQVSFVVDTDGWLSDVKVLHSLDSLLDAEALRVVKSSPVWKAGKENGQAVKVQLSVPVRFRAE